VVAERDGSERDAVRDALAAADAVEADLAEAPAAVRVDEGEPAAALGASLAEELVDAEDDPEGGADAEAETPTVSEAVAEELADEVVVADDVSEGSSVEEAETPTVSEADELAEGGCEVDADTPTVSEAVGVRDATREVAGLRVFVGVPDRVRV